MFSLGRFKPLPFCDMVVKVCVGMGAKSHEMTGILDSPISECSADASGVSC